MMGGQQGGGFGGGGWGGGGGSLGAAPYAPPVDVSRERFLVRTYNHLFGAIVFFALLQIALFKTGVAYKIAEVLTFHPYAWLGVLGGFMVVGWFASRAAHGAESKAAQYGALIGFVVAEAIVFVPLLVMANAVAPGAIQSAAMVTLVGFAGLTGVAFVTRKNFSFLGGLLRWGFMVALLAIVGSLIFGFHLGTWFSVAMVGLAGAAILYDTSRIIRDFPTDRPVAAALELFASVAIMFWYVLRLFMSRD